MVILVETKCSGSRAKEVIREMGFAYYVIEDAEGFSGGIWVLWKINYLRVRVLKSHKQFIHMEITDLDQKNWNLSAIYASPQEGNRKELWENLQAIATHMRHPWMLIGDFNDIAKEHEKKGGTGSNEHACKRFKRRMDSCNLMDLGYVGTKYTWIGGQKNGQQWVFKRLDRAIANPDWRMMFPNAHIEIFPRIQSNHHPILAILSPNCNTLGEKPFRFEAMWCTQEDFSNFVEQVWKEDIKFPEALKNLTDCLKKWNTEVFENIFRRKQNILNRLSDPEMIKKLVMEFFDKFYEEENFNRPIMITFHNPPSLNCNQRRNMEIIPSHWEIEAVIFNIGSLKAPGENGYPALFYKENWSLLKSSVCNYIQSLWRKPEAIRHINKILLTLTPKTNQPEFVSQFRPIALRNVIYKYLAKILVSKIKPTLSERISPNQSSFVPGRFIHDNIIIASEMIHSMKRMKGKNGFMAIKIDFAKAYDRLNWNFLHQCLVEYGISDRILTLIMACVSSTEYQILWNRGKTEKFTPTRDIRQGDPISPYLFVIAMNKLSMLIEDGVEEGNWKPMKAGREGPIISHLLFADDLLLFAEVSENQIRRILRMLQIFSKASGLIISKEKTSILFSKNVEMDTRNKVMRTCSYREVPCLGRYLRTLLTNSKKNKDNYGNIIERVHSRIKGWKTSCLSLAGRITLAQSVINPALNFNMQHGKFSIGVWIVQLHPGYGHNSNPVHILEFFRAPFETWIRWNLTVEAVSNSKTQWKTIFMVTCWWLWFWRNKKIFAPPFKRPPKTECIIMDYIQRLDKAFKKENLIQNVRKREILIGWSPPSELWIKINVDGPACVTTGRAGCGGIIRNYQGRWLAGYMMNIGTCSAFKAELWGVFQGLKMAWDLGFKKAILETDFRAVLQTLQKK
ncbi:uncharacterized protein [Arachis hypogaea]|uniref:uncharacterized protein n=1 Tax=Arachis hypogaea TaxID=3818 RepID=UPI003B21AFCA